MTESNQWQSSVHCYVGNGGDNPTKVVDFATKLFGVPFEWEATKSGQQDFVKATVGLPKRERGVPRGRDLARAGWRYPPPSVTTELWKSLVNRERRVRMRIKPSLLSDQ